MQAPPAVALATQGTPVSDGQASPVPAPRPLSKSKRLVADVIAAGGRLVLSDETGGAGVNWRQRAYAAQRHGKVPVGKHLSVSRTSKGFEIVLHDGATGNELGADEVPVRARLMTVPRYLDVPVVGPN